MNISIIRIISSHGLPVRIIDDIGELRVVVLVENRIGTTILASVASDIPPKIICKMPEISAIAPEIKRPYPIIRKKTSSVSSSPVEVDSTYIRYGFPKKNPEKNAKYRTPPANRTKLHIIGNKPLMVVLKNSLTVYSDKKTPNIVIYNSKEFSISTVAV